PGGCSSKYCRALFSRPATAKQMPQQRGLFARTNARGDRLVSAFRNSPRRLDAARPRADGRVASAVGMQQRERVGRARLIADRDEDSAASGERLENPAVVRLKSDAPHRAGEPE